MAPSAFSAWYQKVADFNVEALFSRKRPPGPPRSVYVNEDLPEEYFDQKHKPRKENVYTTNQVITSKYTVITFLPRNLLEQFRRIANVCVIIFLHFFLFYGLIIVNALIQVLRWNCYSTVLQQIFHHFTGLGHPSATHRPRYHSIERWLRRYQTSPVGPSSQSFASSCLIGR